MNMFKVLISVLFVVFSFNACADDAVNTNNPPMIKSDIIGNDGKKIGDLQIKKATKGVLLEIALMGLPAGKHGMHFHKIGKCTYDHGFKDAKGHIIHDNEPHGFLHPEGPHAGNLPNLIVNPDGTAHIEIYSQLVSFDGENTSILDADGSSLIIHENEDDHKTQPIGGAGGRIACAVIQP